MDFRNFEEAPETAIVDPRQITKAQLQRLGARQFVYLRSRTVDGEPAYAIHSAEGIALAVVEDMELALELALENGMTFVAVH